MAKPETKLKRPEVSGAESVLSLLPEDFLEVVREYEDRLDLELLALAFQYASDKHAGQKRRSGEDFISHCVEVAKILSEIEVTLARGRQPDQYVGPNRAADFGSR